jgi:hypothetical protein
MSEALCRSHARLLGAVYLLYFVAAILSGLELKGLVVAGDVALTARNFAAHEFAVRSSSVLGQSSIILYLATIGLFYELFRCVSRRLSIVATLIAVTGCAIQTTGDAFFISLQKLAASNGGVWTAGGISGLAQFSLAIHSQLLHVALVSFGAFDVLIGVLIFRSGFLPRVFGVLMAIAGLGWLIYLWPPLALELSRIIQPVGFLAEALLMLWLLVKGVNEEQWIAMRAKGPVSNV